MCWDKGFHDDDEQEQSDQKKVARSQIYQKTIQREYQKLCENPKQVKITESLTNPLLSRDYREIKKKISQLLFTITRFSSPTP